MLVDVDWLSVFMTDVRVIAKLRFKLKVATLIHIWVDCLWAPGESSVVQGDPGHPCDHPMVCHPGSKGS